MSAKPSKPKAKPARGSKAPYTGKCLCGCIRYEFSSEPEFPHYCCCDDCQRWSGAPAVAFVDFLQSSFKLDDAGGNLKFYRSSPTSKRGFCGNCGSSLFVIDDDGRITSVMTVTLDRPNLHRPESVSYTSFAPRWLPVAALKAGKQPA